MVKAGKKITLIFTGCQGKLCKSPDTMIKSNESNFFPGPG